MKSKSGATVLALAGLVLFSNIISTKVFADSSIDALDPSVLVSPPLVTALKIPAEPKQGDFVTVILELNPAFTSPAALRSCLSARLDGVPVTLLPATQSMWIARLGTFTGVASHELAVDIMVENKKEADGIRAAITQLDTDIMDIQNALNAETDPGKRTELQGQIAHKTAERTTLQNILATLAKIVGTDTITFSVDPNINMDALLKNISKAQGRVIISQNNDSGFEWLVSDPEVIRSVTNASYANQFGLHGAALLDAYNITQEPMNLVAAKKTAEVLMAKTVYRRTSLYATDGEFMANAAGFYGFPSYRQKAVANEIANEEFYAAIHILNNPSPTEAQVNALAQAELDAVTDEQKVAGCRRRLVEAGGRPAGLRAFDWGSRVRQAAYTGKDNIARLMAAAVAADYSEIQITAPYYLLGLANTITILKLREQDNPATYTPVIANARQKLLAQQKEGGFFTVEPSEGAEAGNLQDAAFIVQALLDINEVEPLKKLINFLMAAQLPTGGYDHFGSEFGEAQSELMGALARVYKNYSAGAMALMMEEFEKNPPPSNHYRLPALSPDKVASPFI